MPSKAYTRVFMMGFLNLRFHDSTYPTLAPALRFSSPIFHPLVNQEGVLETAHQFKEWKPSKDHIHHLLSFLHNCFVDTVLGALEEDICADKEAWRW
jgi:ubiquitin-protein ligase